MRKRLYEIIEAAEYGDKASFIYDIFMLLTIIISIIPLAFKENNLVFSLIELITCSLFIFDYILRYATADYKLEKKGLSFIIYPFTFLAIIDLLSILPAITLLNNGFKLLKLFRVLKIFRVFKTLRYSKRIRIIKRVLSNSKSTLIGVCIIAVSYIIVAAFIIFSVEPDTFNNFFDAVYWSTISLTTVGYGDIYPVTIAGRVVAMLSAIFGIVIIAIPSGIITAGYLEVVKKIEE